MLITNRNIEYRQCLLRPVHFPEHNSNNYNKNNSLFDDLMQLFRALFCALTGHVLVISHATKIAVKVTVENMVLSVVSIFIKCQLMGILCL